MKKHKIFDKNNPNPFELSRTGIDEFLRCPRTFVLKRKFGIKPPSIPPLTLALATDHLLKNEFDRLRSVQSSDHWLFKKFDLNVVPYLHDELEIWRSNFKGIRYHHVPTNMIIYGAIDDIWRHCASDELYLVDYKSTSKKSDPDIETGWGTVYKRQMEIYQWLFKKNGFKVNDLGYFLYVNGVKGDNNFYYDHSGYKHIGFMEFTTTLIPYVGNSDWIERILFKIKSTLMAEELPNPNKGFDLNIYFDERSKIEKQYSEL